MLERIKNMQYEHKYFILFLVLHFLVWSLVGLIRTVLPTDSLEGIYWGYLQDFGTPKHPPLAGWVTYLTYLPFKMDYSIYALSQAFIGAGLVYIYKLGKIFLNESQAMLAVIFMEACWVYTYISGYYGFNPDVILLFLLPVITYVFYDCMKKNRFSDWLKLGVLVGICFLNKYQTGMIVIAMAIWAFVFNRDTFKNKYFYMSIVIAFLIFLPHILWLIKYDFFPFLYFDGELSSPVWYNHITAPLKFFLVQLSLIAGILVFFVLMKKIYKSPFKLRENYEKSEAWFLLIMGFVPIILHLLMGAIEGGNMRPRWGFEFWYLFSISLFYFFPIEINKKEFNFGLKCGYFAMIVTFIALGTLLAVEKNYRSRYPVAQIYGDLTQAWEATTDKPMKYIGGYIEWTLPLTIYAPTHPDCILDTFGYKNPWIDEEDLKNTGILIFDRTPEEVTKQTFKSCPYLPEGYVVTPVEYKFFVKNAFGQEREYTIYYYIVPGEEK